MSASASLPKATDDVTPEFVSSRDAARFLSISEQRLRAWRMARIGPPWRKFGKTVRYSLTELRAWADAQTPPPERAPVAA